MIRRFFFYALVLGGGVALWAAVKPEAWNLAKARVADWLQDQMGPNDPVAVERKALDALNDARKARGSKALKMDTELRNWLNGELIREPADMDVLLRHAQTAFPNYTRLATLSTHHLTASGFQDDVGRWTDGLDGAYTNAVAVSQPGWARIGLGCVLLAGMRLPDFTPELLQANPHGVFFSVCPHCGNGHSCQFGHTIQCISLQCPECHRIYAMLALDAQGHLKYVNEYLVRYQPPAHFPKNTSRLSEMLLIWQEVGRTCRYQIDAANLDPTAHDDPTDTWQTARETECLQAGDCKDSSILVADWLLARGFEARVAVGRYAERGGHAWVVSRLNKREYLLEATQPNPDITRLPLVTQVGSRYVPELLFDYDSIYVRKQPDEPFDGDYWSPSKWLRIVPRPREPARVSAPVDLSMVLAGRPRHRAKVTQ